MKCAALRPDVAAVRARESIHARAHTLGSNILERGLYSERLR